MVLYRRIWFLGAFLVLSLLGILFYAFTDQPYYHSGFSMTVRAEGLYVLNVVDGSPARAAGLRPGMVIESFNGIDAPSLFALSNSDLSRFLRVSTRLFELDHELALEIAGVSEPLRFPIESLPWRSRVLLLERQVLINFLVGLLFLVSGVWLAAVRKNDPVVGWFYAFTLAVALALPLSHFISYWSAGFLAIRFVLLDTAGISAGCALAAFAYRFPDGPPLSRRARSVLGMAGVLFVVKYLAVITESADPLGLVLYLVHAVVGIALVLAIALFVRRYRSTVAGGRRRIRWAVAGIVVSLVPFVLYLAALAARGSILDEGTAVLGAVAVVGLLFFPLFVGIGVVRYNLFDIDRFLNRFAIVAAIAILATGAFSLVFFYFVDTDVNFELYLLVLAVTLISPGLYVQLDRFVDHAMRRRRRDRGYKDPDQILLEMEQELIGVFQKEDVYAIVTSSLVQAFEPTTIAFLSRRDGTEGNDRTIQFSYPDTTEAASGFTGNGDSEAREFFLFREEEERESILRIGGRRDEDIYTREDMRLLSGAAAQVSKTLLTCDLHHRLQESLALTEIAQHTAIMALAKLTEYRDNETGRHLERIQEYTRILTRATRRIVQDYRFLTEEIIDEFCRSSVLHDIGKVGVPDRILLKPGRLEADEFEIIKQHPVIGGQVLEDAEAAQEKHSFLSIAKTVAYQHHEKWDGTGYPFGLSRDDIALPARIVALADVYDALRSVRPYKDAMPHADAVAVVQDGAGTHFDPDLVAVFSAVESEIAAVPR